MTGKRETGWIIVGLIALTYALLYALNLWLPLSGNSSYTTRIWDWSQAGLAGGAVLVLLVKRQAIETRESLIGLGLGVLTGLSHGLHEPSLFASALQGAAVWLTFAVGSVLFKDVATERVAAFQGRLGRVGGSLLFGVAAAIPLVVINNLYFYMNSGAVRFQNVFLSTLEALRPGISEESLYRFFILAFCLSLLRRSEHSRLALIVSLALAVIPHSLNHLPDLFLDNPAMGLFMLTVTSLLFGLPMALLQLKRNFETAVAFHWFIDFARFVFGY